MQRGRVTCWMCTAAAALLAACLSSEPVASRYIKSQAVTAADGATIAVAASDSLDLAGTRLIIPPGALAQDTKITLELGTSPVVTSQGRAAGPVAVWGPTGTRFGRDVEMTLPYVLEDGQSVADLHVQVLEDDGRRWMIGHSALTVDEAARVIRFKATGFSGYQPGTGAPCRADADCARGDACVNGVCQPPPGFCGNAICPPGSVCCDPRCGICSSSGGACPAMTCVGCRTDADCAPGEACLNGKCAPPPPRCGSVVCPPGTVCCSASCGICSSPSGACTMQYCNGCDNTRPCAPGEKCVNGSCQPDPGQCGNRVCPPGLFCCNASCGICAPPGIACTMQWCGDCASDRDCPVGQACVNGVCVAAGCDSSRPCPPGEICAPSGVCQPSGCNTSAGTVTSCPPGQVCIGGVCQPPQCDANRPCPTGSACVNGVCVAISCNTGGQVCRPPEICVNGRCQLSECDSARPCPAGQMCSNGKCQACGLAGQPCCITAANVVGCSDPGLACIYSSVGNGGICLPLYCTSGTPCPAGLSCINGRCQAPCSGNTSCQAGFGCCANVAMCIDMSSDPANCGRCGVVCAATEKCVSGVCMVPPATCRSNTDCPSGRCSSAGVCQ